MADEMPDLQTLRAFHDRAVVMVADLRAELESERAKRKAADEMLERMGYQKSVIYVFGDDGRPHFTSHVGDPAWDTAVNRWRTFDYISRTSEPVDGQVVASVLWSLRRMVELRKTGEAARFRVCWLKRDGRVEYRLEIRRADGAIERPAMPLPLVGESSVEESGT